MHALIVGGGVAGPVTAMALQQVGIEATIFEAHPPSDGELGSYFTVTANGLEALAAIGARELATPPASRRGATSCGTRRGGGLASLPLDSSVAGQPGGPHDEAIAADARAPGRGDPARDPDRTTVGGSARPTVAADGRVLATFDDGSSASGDLLIGADGVHSVVRRPSIPTRRRADTSA